MRLAGHWIAAVLIAFVVSGHAQAQTSAPSTIRVENAWARATPARAKTGAAYVTVINDGSSADSLLSATTPLAQKVQFIGKPKITASRACANCAPWKSIAEQKLSSRRETCT